MKNRTERNGTERNRRRRRRRRRRRQTKLFFWPFTDWNSPESPVCTTWVYSFVGTCLLKKGEKAVVPLRVRRTNNPWRFLSECVQNNERLLLRAWMKVIGSIPTSENEYCCQLDWPPPPPPYVRMYERLCAWPGEKESKQARVRDAQLFWYIENPTEISSLCSSSFRTRKTLFSS